MSPYAEAFANPQGPGDSRPTALQIVKDNNMEDQLIGKVVVITGGSSGLGIETARALVATGATLYLTARDSNKAEIALKGVLQPDQFHLIQMDQSSLDSVRHAAKTILSNTNKINILINNAGIMAIPTVELTNDGFESQFAVNHLSHFLFFNLLKQAMIDASTPDFHSRVVNLSASGHRIQGIHASDNYNFEKGGYEPWGAYAQSKTANIYMANEIERRYGSCGLHGSSLHPGIIATGIGKHLPQETIQAMIQNPFILQVLQSKEQGVSTTVWASIAREWEGKGGKYLVNCSEAERGPDDGDRYSLAYTSHTYSPEDEGRLWKDSLAFVGLSEDN